MTSIKRYSTARGETRWRVRYLTPQQAWTDKRGFSTKRDALEFAAALDVSIRSGAYVAPSAGKITIGALYETWRQDRTRVKSTTVAKSASAWSAHVGPKWSTIAVADVRPSIVRSWVSNMTTQGAGAATIENALGLLRALTDMAVVDRRIPTSPLSGIKPPRRRHQARGYLTHAQVDALARETRTQVIRRRGGSHVTADRPDHELIVLLLAYTGLRWGEMAALRVGSINLSRRRLDIYEAIAEVSGHQVLDSVKNHERRSVPFPEFLTGGLADLMGGKSLNDHIFTGSTGEPIRVSTFRPRAFAPAVERCRGLDPLFPLITPHDLRHTAASLAISAGANPKGVQTMLGHASAAMTLDTYADLFPDDLDAVAGALSEARSRRILGKNWASGPENQKDPASEALRTGSDLR